MHLYSTKQRFDSPKKLEEIFDWFNQNLLGSVKGFTYYTLDKFSSDLTKKFGLLLTKWPVQIKLTMLIRFTKIRLN